MPKCRAKPLPEPKGIIPNNESLLIRHDATSFIVPSPPTATIIFVLLLVASCASLEACPGASVNFISKLNFSELIPVLILFRMSTFVFFS